ncbi:MAG: selenide, water dikinase SelD [Sphingobacteriales bacterium]|nr:selenide, water dikinase SelD [Sphingobacteriales bacterium]
MTQEPIRLTQFSHGAGCGCKIAPKVLDEILKTSVSFPDNDKLLVGNHSRDDAAVYDLGNGTAIISTTDFFMPIVDDPYEFGRVAAANSISDIYAMGGKPLMAIAVLGWPVNKIPAEVAQKVVEGGRSICAEAGIPLAGGHSIDSPEPIFGLAVTGIVPIEHLKQNNTAREGDLLFLTKPLGVGILSTAQKRGLLKEDLLGVIVKQMTTLNKTGEELGKIKGVHAMTDVTGFGLLGHLIELAGGSGLSAEIWYDQIPAIPGVKDYIAQGVFPDGTTRNWSSYGENVKFEKGTPVAEAFKLLPDPQTNGGLLIAVAEEAKNEIIALFAKNGLADFTSPIGRITAAGEKLVLVKP